VGGAAHYAGTLEVDLSSLAASADGVRVIAHDRSSGRFSALVVTGAADSAAYELDYRKDGVYLVAERSHGSRPDAGTASGLDLPLSIAPARPGRAIV
jgi:hypothetical protein